MPAPALRTDIRVSDDRNTLSITFHDTSDRSATVRLNLDDLSALIGALGSARQTMAAGRPIPSLQGRRVETILRPQWYIQPEPLTEGSVISCLVPAFAGSGRG